MKLSELNKEQRLALIDLMVLAMYTDGHLGLDEDARVQGVLQTMGFDNVYDRQREFDASVTRVSQHAVNAEKARSHATALAASFTTPEQGRFVFDTVRELIESDGQVAPDENRLITSLRQILPT